MGPFCRRHARFRSIPGPSNMPKSTITLSNHDSCQFLRLRDTALAHFSALVSTLIANSLFTHQRHCGLTVFGLLTRAFCAHDAGRTHAPGTLRDMANCRQTLVMRADSCAMDTAGYGKLPSNAHDAGGRMPHGHCWIWQTVVKPLNIESANLLGRQIRLKSRAKPP